MTTATDTQTLTSIHPIAVNAAGAAALFRLSEKTWRRLDVAGQVPAPVMLSGCVRWSVEELQHWGRCGCPARVPWERLKELTSARLPVS